MPRYTCTTTIPLSNKKKEDLAHAITDTNCDIIQSPSKYVHVIIHELPMANMYTDYLPSDFLLIEASIRAGRADQLKTELALAISEASSTSTGISEENIMVSIKETPARFVAEGGGILPEPGMEQATN